MQFKAENLTTGFRPYFYAKIVASDCFIGSGTVRIQGEKVSDNKQQGFEERYSDNEGKNTCSFCGPYTIAAADRMEFAGDPPDSPIFV